MAKRDKEHNAPEASAANIGMRLLIIGLPALVVCALIGFMKLKSDEQSPVIAEAVAQAERAADADTTTAPIAVPDTTVDLTVLPALPDTLPAAPPDSIGIDARSPLTAGHEDGLLAGAYDRRYGSEYGISYDDTNTFPTADEQHAYSEGYREGYAEGYRLGGTRPAEGNRPQDSGNPETP
ncbi:MAG: hypothetical protein IJ684_07130 [Bacteroidales bacterium]|nr:hypothetical protein [Alloprevotella sp.]MBR1645124.1 hypothetical protein [Bacteroidales bacterium]